MKKIIYATLIVIVSITVFGQQAKPLKFGFELDGKLKKVNPNSGCDSPTEAAYVGMFTEFHVANHFSGKLRVGLNNTYYHRDELNGYDYITGLPINFPEITTAKQTVSVSLEPRIYFYSTKNSRKINLYIALPVVFESAPIWNEKNFIYVSSELTFIPTLGIRYDFAKHFGIEASGGYGKGWYFTKYDLLKKEQKEYSLSVGLRYAF